MEINEKFKKLIELLHRKTVNNDLEWTLTSNNSGAIVNIADRWVSIEKVENDFSDPFVVVKMFGTDGQVVDSFTDDDLASMGFFSEGVTFYEVMSDLADRAVIKGKGVNESLDAILSELDDDVPF